MFDLDQFGGFVLKKRTEKLQLKFTTLLCGASVNRRILLNSRMYKRLAQRVTVMFVTTALLYVKTLKRFYFSTEERLGPMNF